MSSTRHSLNALCAIVALSTAPVVVGGQNAQALDKTPTDLGPAVEAAYKEKAAKEEAARQEIEKAANEYQERKRAQPAGGDA